MVLYAWDISSMYLISVHFLTYFNKCYAFFMVATLSSFVRVHVRSGLCVHVCHNVLRSFVRESGTPYSRNANSREYITILKQCEPSPYLLGYTGFHGRIERFFGNFWSRLLSKALVLHAYYKYCLERGKFCSRDWWNTEARSFFFYCFYWSTVRSKHTPYTTPRNRPEHPTKARETSCLHQVWCLPFNRARKISTIISLDRASWMYTLHVCTYIFS